MNYEEIAKFIEKQPSGTKVYIGCDSERVKKNGTWFADYIVAVVVHIAGNKGCKVFGHVYRDRDYDKKKNAPRLRLMTEVYRASEAFLNLVPLLDESIETEVHLDINPNENYGSSCVINEAIGYIKGTCNVVPLVKPDSWAASAVADRFKRIVA